MTDTELRDALGQLKHDVQEAAKLEFQDSLNKAVADIDHRIDELEANQQTARLDSLTVNASREFRDYLTSGAIDGSVVRRIMDDDPTAGTTGNSGILIPKPIVQKIIEYSMPGNPLRQLADVVTISIGDTYAAGDELGAVGSGWVGETEARPVTASQTYGSIEIPLREVYAEPKYTNRLLADNAFNLEERITRAIGRAFGTDENTGFFSGSGNKQPAGILNATTVADANWVPGKVGTIESASGTAIAGNDIINLKHALDDRYIDNAVWIMSKDIWTKISQLKSGTSGADRYLLWTPDIVDGRIVRSLMGLRVYLTSAMTKTVSAGQTTIMIGDFLQAYTIVDKAGISMIRDNITDKGSTKFYTSKRVGGGLTNTEAVKFLVQPGSPSSASSSASDPGSSSASASASIFSIACAEGLRYAAARSASRTPTEREDSAQAAPAKQHRHRSTDRNFLISLSPGKYGFFFMINDILPCVPFPDKYFPCPGCPWRFPCCRIHGSAMPVDGIARKCRIITEH